MQMGITCELQSTNLMRDLLRSGRELETPTIFSSME